MAIVHLSKHGLIILLLFFCLLYVSIVYPLEVLTSGEIKVVHKTLLNPPSSSILPSKPLLTVKQIASGNLLYFQSDHIISGQTT